MSDLLGDRMKRQYEDRTRMSLPRRTYTIIRLDGKAFHSVTRNMRKPYDDIMMAVMDNTGQALCEEIQGAEFAYVQSDEISLLLTDFAKQDTCAWFDGNVQKIVSVSASLATAAFNREMDNYGVDITPAALFDSRCFTIPDPVEVENYFIWRQKDWERNSVQMLAQTMFSQKQLDGVKREEQYQMCLAKGSDWKTFEPRVRSGGLACRGGGAPTIFSFMDERDKLKAMIPVPGYEK